MLLWIGLAALLAPGPVQADTEMPPVEAYAALPQFADLEIAPGGRFLAARTNIDNVYRVLVLDLSAPGVEVVYSLSENDEYYVSRFQWAGPDRLLISIGFVGKRGRGQRIDTAERRLFSVKIGENEMIPLFRAKRDEIPVQIQDRIVSLLPDDPKHILLQHNSENPANPRVYRVDVTKTTRHARVEGERRSVRYWKADNDGDVRIGWGRSRDGDPKLFLRLKGKRKWLDFSEFVEEPNSVFRPVGFASDPNIAYVISNHEIDPAGLYRFDIEERTFSELIYSNPAVDISGVGIDAVSGEVSHVNFIDADAETLWFSKSPINEAIGNLSEKFPGKSLTTYTIADDREHAVIRLNGTRDAGQYAVFNHAVNGVKLLPPQYPGISAEALAETFATEYEARDGLTIPAFVTLPPGMTSLEEADNLPFVIHPHGGPTSRDFLRFDFSVQFWASRGYGVLQMNFRGSSGYGTEFRKAGDKEWGQAMQDDITDGVSWLVESGFADQDRVAIVGGSYGGYAALMGVVKTPDQYRCAISFAGVTDLPDIIRDERRFIDGRYRTRFIGDLWRDRKMLATNSPARRAEDIQVPVLLIHGDADTVVDVDQSEKMAKRLKKLGKPHELIIFEDGDHHLSLYRHRLKYLRESERFLGECLAPRN